MCDVQMQLWTWLSRLWVPGIIPLVFRVQGTTKIPMHTVHDRYKGSAALDTTCLWQEFGFQGIIVSFIWAHS